MFVLVLLRGALAVALVALGSGPSAAAPTPRVWEAEWIWDRAPAAEQNVYTYFRKELTLADFTVAAPLFYIKEAGLPVEPYRHVQEWFGRVSALPCWRETAPQHAAAAA